MPFTLKENRIVVAPEALQNDGKLSLQATAKLYNMPVSTLSYRHAGRSTRRDLPVNSPKLTDLEE